MRWRGRRWSSRCWFRGDSTGRRRRRRARSGPRPAVARSPVSQVSDCQPPGPDTGRPRHPGSTRFGAESSPSGTGRSRAPPGWCGLTVLRRCRPRCRGSLAPVRNVADGRWATCTGGPRGVSAAGGRPGRGGAGQECSHAARASSLANRDPIGHSRRLCDRGRGAAIPSWRSGRSA
jgi:hypothetical protein